METSRAEEGNAGGDSDLLRDTQPNRIDIYFYGQGGEYFRIWMVNFALTLLTFGIYSAWAKVRTKKYFYGNTEMAGSQFEYLADPITILKSRLVVIALLIIYYLLDYFYASGLFLTIMPTVLFVIAIPFVILRALRFNALMSSWRGIRFGHDGTPANAVAVFLLWPLWGMITLGLGMPYAWYQQNHFLIDNYRFGTSTATSLTTAGDCYAKAWILIGLGFSAGVASWILTTDDGMQNVVIYFLMGLGLYTTYRALSFNLIYHNIRIANNTLYSRVTPWGWFKIALGNIVMMLVTLGLFYPWARVRLTHYLLSNLWVEAQDLDSFVAHEKNSESAMGEEIGEAFDVSSGL